MYGAAQTLLLCAFAGAYFLDRSAWLWPRGGLSGILGTAFCAAGLLLVVSAIVTLRRVIQIAPEPRQGGELVTQGVYSRFRHPIYTGIVILVAGLFLRRPTVLVGAMAALVIAYLAFKVRLEEKLLAARYPEYPSYRKRTWGLLPGWRG